MMVLRGPPLALLLWIAGSIPVVLAWTTGVLPPQPRLVLSSLSLSSSSTAAAPGGSAAGASSASASSGTSSSSSSSWALLLHDLERVVQRRPRVDPMEQAERDIRRRKFVTIVDDEDGCERGILMLEKWRRDHHHSTTSNDSSTATAYLLRAYEVCACALVENRWRAQWKVVVVPPKAQPSSTAASSSSTISDIDVLDSSFTTTINTADQLLTLYEWMTEADGMVPSLTFLDAVLAGLASCSSPHPQSRGYGTLAHDIWQRHLPQILEQQQQQQQQPSSSALDEKSTASTSTDDSSSSAALLSMMLAFHVVRGYCWQQANHGRDDCARAADQLYHTHLLLLHSTDHNNNNNHPLHSSLLDAPARRLLTEAYSKAVGGASRCQELYDSFLVTDNKEEDDDNTPPEDVMINTVLAWSKQPGGAERAEALLLSSVRQNKKQKPEIKIDDNDNADGDTTIDAGITQQQQRQPPQRVNLLAAQAVVTAWGRAGRPDRAESLLPYCATTRCTNSVLHGWLSWADKDAALGRIEKIIATMAAPNAFTYATLIKAYAQAGSPSASHAKAAVKAWRQLVGLREQGGDDSIKTDPVVISNICLSVCARAADGVLARQLLREHQTRLPHHPPDTIFYTTVLQAIANDEKKVIMDNIDVADGCTSAEDVIVRLFEQCPRPNERTYAMAILALAHHNGSPQTAYEIMLRGHPHENSFPYNYVLTCCNNYVKPAKIHKKSNKKSDSAMDEEDDKYDSFRIAAKTFKLIPLPNSYSYSTWLRCVQNLIPEDDTANLRERCLRHAVAGAKKHGCWDNETVRSRFAQCCPRELREELMPSSSSSR